MQSSAEFESDVLEAIKTRRSRRAFTDKAVEPEKIKALFEAARWAPSANNEQPWTYIYATPDQTELWDKILSTLNEGNRLWAKNATLLVVSLARKHFKANGNPNGAAKYDIGAANAFLTLQAAHLGLNAHIMGGFNHDLVRQNLNVPETFDVGVVIAIGYPGDADQLQEPFKEREKSPRVRHAQSEFVMNTTF